MSLTSSGAVALGVDILAAATADGLAGDVFAVAVASAS